MKCNIFKGQFVSRLVHITSEIGEILSIFLGWWETIGSWGWVFLPSDTRIYFLKLTAKTAGESLWRRTNGMRRWGMMNNRSTHTWVMDRLNLRQRERPKSRLTTYQAWVSLRQKFGRLGRLVVVGFIGSIASIAFMTLCCAPVRYLSCMRSNLRNLIR